MIMQGVSVGVSVYHQSSFVFQHSLWSDYMVKDVFADMWVYRTKGIIQ